MGVYDILPRGSQVKCWENRLVCYKVGDNVPSIVGGCSSYIVLLVEGGYVQVEGDKITKIVENEQRKAYYPEDFKMPCFTKWGDLVETREELNRRMYYWWQDA